ncbi:MAG: isoprenylcysteine carboxylmethyltransferase family protein [bacterium]
MTSRAADGVPTKPTGSLEGEHRSRSRLLLAASGRFFFRLRNGLFPAVFVILFLVTRPAYFLGAPALDRLIVAIGIATALAGASFRMAVIGYAYIRRGGKDGRIFADRLVVQGFYAHTRNPMYVGNFLITVGMGLIYGSVWVYVLVIPFFAFAYLSIVVAEETYLRARFGSEFEAYASRVNRFLPDFRGLRGSLREFRFDWRKALRKDYGTLSGVLAGILFVIQWKEFYYRGFEFRSRDLLPLSLFVPVLVFYTVVRRLKKTRRLVSR